MTEAEAFYEQELSLPLYPSMTNDDVQLVIEAIKQCIKSA